jgi:hypothetical protein
MYQIPLNKWTISAFLALAALMGGDFFSAVMRAVTALGSSYVPAV